MIKFDISMRTPGVKYTNLASEFGLFLMGRAIHPDSHLGVVGISLNIRKWTVGQIQLLLTPVRILSYSQIHALSHSTSNPADTLRIMSIPFFASRAESHDQPWGQLGLCPPTRTTCLGPHTARLACSQPTSQWIEHPAKMIIFFPHLNFIF